ncbi:MAG: hypothetical protein WCD37_03650 [Chloroflexia bacterium]
MDWTDIPGVLACVLLVINYLHNNRDDAIKDLEGRLGRALKDATRLERTIGRIIGITRSCNNCASLIEQALYEDEDK